MNYVSLELRMINDSVVFVNETIKVKQKPTEDIKHNCIEVTNLNCHRF